MKNMIFICPDDDFECPYYKKGFCYMMSETGSNPIEKCDAWAVEDYDDEEEADE